MKTAINGLAKVNLLDGSWDSVGVPPPLNKIKNAIKKQTQTTILVKKGIRDNVKKFALLKSYMLLSIERELVDELAAEKGYYLIRRII